MSDRNERLAMLRQAIIDHTKGEDMFWLSEILLHELDKALRPPRSAEDQEAFRMAGDR